jgi:hypothetical protein
VPALFDEVRTAMCEPDSRDPTRNALPRPGSNPSHNPEGEGRDIRGTPTPRPGQSAGSVAAPPGPLLINFPPAFGDSIEQLSERRAAFRLGLHSRAIWRLHLLYLLFPWVPRREDWVSHTVSNIRGARFVLIREIHKNVSPELRDVLQEWQAWYRLDEARRKEGDDLGLNDSTPPSSWDVTGLDHRRILTMMADEALDGAHPLRPWYQLGALLGAYGAQLLAHLLSGGGENDLGRLSAVGPLVRHIESLPSAYLDQLPGLRSFAKQLPVLDQFDESTFLAMIGEWEVPDWGQWPAWPKVWRIDVLLGMLVHYVDEVLGSIESPEPVGEGRGATPDGVATTPPQPGSDPAGRPVPVKTRPGPKPRWDKPGATLQYCGEDIRHVEPRGVNITKILDAFQKSRWKRRIPDPLADPYAKSKDAPRLQEAVKTLNKGINKEKPHIIFRLDGTGKGVLWEAVSPTTP